MTREKRYSRLDPAYLGRRHAGMVFMLLALGLLAGVAWRSLVQPTRYGAEAAAAVSVTPPERAEAFDWDAKRIEWENIPHDGRDQGLLEVNLRHALKLAATRDRKLDVSPLREELARFEPSATYSTLLFTRPALARFGPVMEVGLRDLAVNLDFQSLAAIIADLAPPEGGAAGWDFSFFTSFSPDSPEAGVISDIGPDDPYFRVLYTLYKAVNHGREPGSSAAAWQGAVEELTRRLQHEAQNAGGGGFGPLARRELMREIAALPVLIANRLYGVNGWFGGGKTAWARSRAKNITIDLRRNNPASGTVVVGMETELYPLAFPRDTAATRLPPLVVSTVISFLSAREAALARKAAPSVAPSAAPVVPAEAGRVESAAPEPDGGGSEPAPAVAYHEIVDETANQRRLAHIATLEDALRAAVRDKEARIRRLDAARRDETRLGAEAIGARARADRIQERYDAAAALAEADREMPLPEETARLLARRDATLLRLTELLTTCTEEHPFVRAARRDLEALEAAIGEQGPPPALFRLAEERATRAANLRLEWEYAESAADALEERRRRQAEAIACFREELEEGERLVGLRESELAEARRAPLPVIRIEAPAEIPAVAVPFAFPVPPETAFAAAMPAADVVPSLIVDGAPPVIPLRREPPGWGAVWLGALAGLALGVLWALSRELFALRFFSPAEARRMVRLPVLAFLPAYDPGSIATAAGTMKGELAGSGPGAVQFIPAPIEMFEPAAEARRGKIVPAATRRRLAAWVVGLGALLLAGVLLYASRAGFAQPNVWFEGELPLPAATIPAWGGERETISAGKGGEP